MSLTKRFYHGVLWSILGTLFSKGSIFVSTIIVARTLGKNDFGQLDIIQSTVGMFGVFAGLGLGLTVTKHVAELYKTNKEKTARIMGLAYLVAVVTSLVIVIGIIFNASFIATTVLNAPNLSPLLQIGSLMLFFNTLTGIQTSALSGLEKFKDIAFINLSIGIISFPLIVLGVYLYNLKGVVVSLVIISIINFMLNRYFLIKRLNEVNIAVDYYKSYIELSLLWTYALPAFLSGIMLGPTLWIARTFLTHENNGYIALGVFSAVILFQNIIYMLSNSINGVLLPILSSKEGKNNILFNQTNFYISWVIGIILTSPLIFFPEIAEFTLGEKYAGHDFRITLLIIMNVVIIYTFKQGMARLLAVKNMMWLGSLDNFIWSLILIFVSWNLVDLGAIGLALAFLIAYIINMLISIPYFIYKKVFSWKLIVNWYVIIVWVIIILNTYISYNFNDIGLRIGAFLLSASIFLLSTLFFAKTLKDNKKAIV
ncbi:MAG TPA: hypothetical protein EYG73_01930 [Arcobacter sp.]|nr:hypothetical protein [Arcobacter sp.]